jgi:DtxR family transcriptional regulator, Mn-dependent transcriptional regulator
MSEAASESVEMYLKSVAELGGESAPVAIGRVAERLGISPVSANEMMKRLARQALIEHVPYRGVTLTESGGVVANSVIRRQRLWEVFLIDHLGLDWARAHDLACDLEHATASEVAAALDAYLGHPARCPHGNPIPDTEGRLPPVAARPLARLQFGRPALLVAIEPESSEVLAYLSARGLRPGVTVTVVEAAPLQGPLTLELETGWVDVGLALAELILVEEIDDVA